VVKATLFFLICGQWHIRNTPGTPMAHAAPTFDGWHRSVLPLASRQIQDQNQRLATANTNEINNLA